jgi:hypothetical protein
MADRPQILLVSESTHALALHGALLDQAGFDVTARRPRRRGGAGVDPALPASVSPDLVIADVRARSRADHGALRRAAPGAVILSLDLGRSWAPGELVELVCRVTGRLPASPRRANPAHPAPVRRWATLASVRWFARQNPN